MPFFKSGSPCWRGKILRKQIWVEVPHLTAGSPPCGAPESDPILQAAASITEAPSKEKIKK